VRFGAIVLVVSLIMTSCRRGADLPDSTGTFEATVVEISCTEPGTVIYLPVEEGRELQEGDTIAVLDTAKLAIERESTNISLEQMDLLRRQAQTQRELAEIQLQAAEREFRRVKSLHDEGSIGTAELDRLQTQLDVAQNAVLAARIAQGDLDYRERGLREKLRLVEKRVSDAIVRAPTGGTVVEKYHETGETLSPGESIVSLADLRHMYALLYIPETKLGSIRLNQTLRLRVDSHPDRKFEGRISWISPQAEFTPKNVQTREARVELVYAIKVMVANPEGIFKIGMPVEAYLE